MTQRHQTSTTMAGASIGTRKPKKSEKKSSWFKKQRMQKEARINVKEQSKKDPNDPRIDQSFLSPMSPKGTSFNQNDQSLVPTPAAPTSRVGPENEDPGPAAMATASIDTHRNKRKKRMSWIEEQMSFKRGRVLLNEMQRAEPCFPFLSLPAEIRNMIYGYALDARWLVSKKKRSCRKYRKKTYEIVRLYCPVGANTSLIRTCQQIYHETRCMLFEINTFSLHSIMFPDLRIAVRSWPIWQNIRKLKMSACCKNLKQLNKLLKTLQEHPSICLRKIDLTIIGLKVASDISPLQNLKVEDSIQINVHTFFMSPLNITGLQNELDFIVPRMMGKLCSGYVIYEAPP